jgi:hypothetical protein
MSSLAHGPEKWISLTEAALSLGKDKSVVSRAAKSGKLRSRQTGNRVEIAQSSIDAEKQDRARNEKARARYLAARARRACNRTLTAAKYLADGDDELRNHSSETKTSLQRTWEASPFTHEEIIRLPQWAREKMMDWLGRIQAAQQEHNERREWVDDAIAWLSDVESRVRKSPGAQRHLKKIIDALRVAREECQTALDELDGR